MTLGAERSLASVLDDENLHRVTRTAAARVRQRHSGLRRAECLRGDSALPAWDTMASRAATWTLAESSFRRALEIRRTFIRRITPAHRRSPRAGGCRRAALRAFFGQLSRILAPAAYGRDCARNRGRRPMNALGRERFGRACTNAGSVPTSPCAIAPTRALPWPGSPGNGAITSRPWIGPCVTTTSDLPCFLQCDDGAHPRGRRRGRNDCRRQCTNARRAGHDMCDQLAGLGLHGLFPSPDALARCLRGNSGMMRPGPSPSHKSRDGRRRNRARDPRHARRSTLRVHRPHHARRPVHGGCG